MLDSGVPSTVERWHAATFMSYGDGSHLGVSLDRKVKEVYWNQFLHYAHDRQYTDQSESSVRDIADDYIKNSLMNDSELRVFEKLLDSRIVTDYATSLEDLSIWWYNAGEDYSGGGHTEIVSSFGSVVEHYASSLPQDIIQLNSVVTAINYQNDIAQIEYEREDESTHEINARKVIVTVPLGVLKDDMISFQPKLPDEKLDAIKSLSMGTLDKCIFAWNDGTSVPWNSGWVQRIANDIDDQGKWTEFVSLDYSFGGRPILVGLAAGRNADELVEDADDSEVKQTMLESLRSIFGTANVPEPEEVIVKRWKSDPFARGSYSNYPLGSSMDHREELGSPVDKKLFFVGEATHMDYWATTHGALLSGVDAATDVIEALSKKRTLRGRIETTSDKRKETKSHHKRPLDTIPRRSINDRK